MSTKHVKLNRPTNVDLVRNPLIGGSKGTAMAGVTPDELEEFEGANTFEGDIENDTNPQGGIDKAEVRDRRRGPPQNDRDSGPRKMALQERRPMSSNCASLKASLMFPMRGRSRRRSHARNMMAAQRLRSAADANRNLR
ncbi:hypothetical protein ACF1BQ_016315 [Bradyrhizobium sp. RDT10]